MVDCSEASSKDCHHAQHAANAFDTEKVALMHGIFQMLQTPPGKAPIHHSPCYCSGAAWLLVRLRAFVCNSHSMPKLRYIIHCCASVMCSALIFP